MKDSISIRASDASHRPRRGLHQHKHYEILIIKQGGGHHIVDFERFDVQENQIFFMRPGQTHEFSPQPGSEFYFIAFDKDEVMMNAPTQLRQFEFFQSFHCDGPVQLDEVDSIIKQMIDVQYELNHPGTMQSVLISGLVTVLLIKIQRKFRQFAAIELSEFNELVMHFNQLVDDPACLFRFVKDYAKHLHVSATYLNDTVKKVTGRPASYWIQKKQVVYAKQLLNDRRLNFKMIAAQLGFTDATHFARFFKSQTKATPTAYRASLT
tara:strand:- start:651 stop:1448 length:798 start_codon:yes stop_codon:yes gene_type:complete